MVKFYIKLRNIFKKVTTMFNMNPMTDFGSGPGGPMISGKWMNKHTGTIINVRDSIMEGNDMYIITDHGQLDFAIFSRDYIQASDEMYDENGTVIGNSPVTANEVVQPVNNVQHNAPVTAPTQPYINPLTTPIVNGTPMPTSTQSVADVQTTTSETDRMLSKIFNKIETEPKITISIEWTDFPVKELEMLVNYFDVTSNDIAQYMGKHYLNADAVGTSIEEFLQDKI